MRSRSIFASVREASAALSWAASEVVFWETRMSPAAAIEPGSKVIRTTLPGSSAVTITP